MIDTYVALDTETTGVSPASDRIIEIGMAKVCGGKITDTYSTLVDPQMKISARITDITGITDADVAGKPIISDIIGDIIAFIGDLPILGHNIIFDYKFIKAAAINNSYRFEKDGIDTLKMARRILPEQPHKNLEFLCAQLGIDPGNSHRAYDDALSAMKLYNRLYEIEPSDPGFEKAVALVAAIKKDTPITPAQIRYLSALIDMHGVKMDKDIGELTKSEASRMIDGIISTYGR